MRCLQALHITLYLNWWSLSFTAGCKSVYHLFRRLEIPAWYVLGAADGALGRECRDANMKMWLSWCCYQNLVFASARQNFILVSAVVLAAGASWIIVSHFSSMSPCSHSANLSLLPVWLHSEEFIYFMFARWQTEPLLQSLGITATQVTMTLMKI